MRRLTLGVLALGLLAVAAPVADAHPLEGSSTCRGPLGGVHAWPTSWDPYDPEGEGLHKVNAVGCYDHRTM